MDGRAVLSCMVLAVEAAGHEVLTIQGLPDDDPVIQAFACQCEPGHGTALQCGFCTPGAVMTAKAFLDENPDPTLEEVKEALAGNLCRCGCYQGIAQAVLAQWRPPRTGGPSHDVVTVRAPRPAPLRRHLPAAHRRPREGQRPRRVPGRRALGVAAKGCCTRGSCAALSRTPVSSASTPRRPRRCPASTAC